MDVERVAQPMRASDYPKSIGAITLRNASQYIYLPCAEINRLDGGEKMRRGPLKIALAIAQIEIAREIFACSH